jgi:PAS domain S-box-containing protein
MIFPILQGPQTGYDSTMLHILLLEDDPVDYELIDCTLRKSGIEGNMSRVANQTAFLDYLSRYQPDIILADYVLPQFDGIAALALAQQHAPDVPFILVSGVLGEEQAIDALKRGATDYVLKQRLERLGPAVKRALREKQEQRERQMVTRALRQTDDLLSAIVDASPVGIVTLNRGGRVMTWNPAAEKIYGWPARAVIDHPLPLLPKDDQAYFAECFNQVLDNNTVANLECRHLKRSGTPIDISLSLAPLHDSDDHIYGVVMTAVDITLHKQIEIQRQTLLQQERHARTAAETANRVKDEFLAVLSHELRTPLNAILGWIKLIQRGGLKPAIQQRAFDTIERNAIAQTQLIDDLLDISRIIRGQVNLTLQSVDIAALLRTTVDTLGPAAAAKSIQVNLDLDPEVGQILGDTNRLQQVFWNLLSNGIKFTPAHGSVNIRGTVQQNQMVIQVQDSGIGIDADFLPYLFEYFRQADSSTTRSQGGLGLGLAITRRLIELHGGTIQVESLGLNQGAVFTVRLPIRNSREIGSDVSSHANQPLSLQGIKAIVVDDEDDAQALLRLILEEWGAHVQSTDNARDALDMVKTFYPDVIITDIGMPQQDGYSLLQTLRQYPDPHLRHIPAIALTAYARQEDREHALAVGFQEHLAKPFEPAEVVDAVVALVRD